LIALGIGQRVRMQIAQGRKAGGAAIELCELNGRFIGGIQRIACVSNVDVAAAPRAEARLALHRDSLVMSGANRSAVVRLALLVLVQDRSKMTNIATLKL